MEALQSNVGLLKENADGIKNLDSCILEQANSHVESWMSSARPKDSRSLKKSRGTRNRTKEHQVGPIHYSPVRNYLSCLPKDSLVIQKIGSCSGIPLTLLFMQMHRNYLRSLLEGVALAAVSGLSLTESNYKNAIEILTERFGNKQLIISSHMEALLQLPAVTSITDIQRIRMINDKVEANVRGLEALGIASDTYGSLLVPVMMNKLPEELAL